MECELEEMFVDEAMKDPSSVWVLAHMEECPECAGTYEVLTAIREA
jgi:hypothetical protein